jgi:hypothetical protein
VSKPKAKQEMMERTREPIFSVRFLIALLLIAAGIAYVVIYTVYVRDVRDFENAVPQPKGGEPNALFPWMDSLDSWNWVIGFGLIMVGLAISAHPKTPLGRGKGVIVGMLGCFLIGLIWICTFYVFADKPEGEIWLIGDLGQLNLLVGIGFMAVGFTFATRWE